MAPRGRCMSSQAADSAMICCCLVWLPADRAWLQQRHAEDAGRAESAGRAGDAEHAVHDAERAVHDHVHAVHDVCLLHVPAAENVESQRHIVCIDIVKIRVTAW